MWGEREIIYISLVTTRMTYASRWAAMSDFNVSEGSDGQSHKTVSTNHNLFFFLKTKKSRSGIEPRSFRLPALRLTAGPNRLTGSLRQSTQLFPHVFSISVFPC